MPTRTPFSESRSLTVAPNALPSVHGLTGWRLEGNTVVVSWSTGYAGLRARLLPADGLWIGEAESFWDFPRERQRRRLTLSPVACDAPLTITESDQKFVPRSLRLSNGTELTLLDPYNPNERWERRPGKRSRWIYRESIDRVGPTEEIRISPDRQDRLQVIVARLHSDTDFVALVERLAAWLGPPSGTATHSWAEVESESVGWRNRTTSLSLMRSRRIGEEWHVTVLLSERRRRF